VRDELAAPLDAVGVAEPRASDLRAPCPHGETVVKVRGLVVAKRHVGRERLDPALLDRLVATRVHVEPRDARDLTPDEKGCVVRDSLCVGLSEAHLDVGREREAFHPASLISRLSYDHGMSVRALAELIESGQPCVVLTGAGISTESGIPDFRSPTGIWAQ